MLINVCVKTPTVQWDIWLTSLSPKRLWRKCLLIRKMITRKEAQLTCPSWAFSFNRKACLLQEGTAFHRGWKFQGSNYLILQIKNQRERMNVRGKKTHVSLFSENKRHAHVSAQLRSWSRWQSQFWAPKLEVYLVLLQCILQIKALNKV